MIREQLHNVLEEIPKHVTLVAVSKTKPVSAIEEAYAAGQRHYGENKVQELVEKAEQLPKDIQWHLIGHLQSNKVKYVAPFVALIHSVDSLKLLLEINRQAAKKNRVIPVLLQFHIAQEETKFGFSLEEVLELLNSEEFKNLGNIRIDGVMGMASFTDDEAQIRKEFKLLKTYFDELKSTFFNEKNYFSICSMGMSGDYLIAIEEGSTMIRVGSSIFGLR
jgi:pyridoxal phosphate enzyme (YggS family)